MKPCLLSIIIPCYNSGMFLQKTIDMLEKEDVNDCEIILIDDGSCDNTLSIMEENNKRYNNIRYFSRENRGDCETRNDGISRALGEYIYFLDSDDEVAEGSISYFKTRLAENGTCDLLAFGYKMVYENGKEKSYVNAEFDGCLLCDEKCADVFFRGILHFHICSIVINRKFLLENNLLFREGYKIGADYDFVRRITLHSKSTLYCSRLFYIYKLRKGSVTDGGKQKYNYDSFRSMLLSVDSVNEAQGILDDNTINYFMAYRYVAHLLSYLKSNYKSDEVTRFFLQNRTCLYKRMNKGSRKVNLAIMACRMLPIPLILKMLKQRKSFSINTGLYR